MASKESRDFIASLVKLADTTPDTARSGMKTTKVPGYPIFLTWGRWGGTELTASGNTKAFLFLPYLQTGPMPLQKYNGVSSLETPLDMVMSDVPNPYNCKINVTPSLNVSRLQEGDYYAYIIGLLPAAVSGGGGNNTTPYWDGWLKGFGSAHSDFKEYFSLFNTTKSHWTKLKKIEDNDDENGNDTSDSPQQQ